MRVSLNHIRRYVDFELPSTEELVTRINRQLGKVDELIDLRSRYEGAIIVKVVSCEKHPDADKLNVCLVDDGSGETTQVVCGAPNVRADMFAVWLKPGATVPSTADDDEPFVLGARELRGVLSNGMLASPKELAIGDGHDGILEVTEYDLVDGALLAAGASFAELFGMDDTIIDIENKMFTHRPDLFGQLGVAREIAGISGKPFVSPDWYITAPEFASVADLDLTTFNQTEGAVPRIMFLPMKDVVIKPSPLWLQCALVALGSKPINNVVDATNYTMLLTAQPTHAYDYDKLRGKTIGARMADQGETVKLLNGKTYSLNDTDIVIADGDGPVGLGGIMGGCDSDVSESTARIVLEVATFDMYAVRKSSMRHGIFTDALARFNKGQSPRQNPYVISYLSTMVSGLSGAVVAGETTDLCDDFVKQPSMYAEDSFVMKPDFANARLGLDLSGDQVKSLLSNVELRTEYDPSTDLLDIDEPFWRTDIELPEDIVEEIGRLYGFDRLPKELPRRSMKPATLNARRELKDRVRQSLSRAGANELLTYSFIHGKLLETIGFDPDSAFKLSNAVSPELQYYRPSVLPSLLDKVHMNIKNGYDEFALFEVGKQHHKQLSVNDEGLPREVETIDMVYAAKKPRSGAAFYRLRRLLDFLADDLDIKLGYAKYDDQGESLFEVSRTAVITDTRSGRRLGVIGEFSLPVSKKFKLPEYAAGLIIDFDNLYDAVISAVNSYRSLSRYPSVSQDISLKVPIEAGYQNVVKMIESVIEETEELTIDVTPRAIYKSEDDDTHTTVTVRLNVTSYERTLTDKDVRPVIDSIAKRANEELSGVIV